VRDVLFRVSGVGCVRSRGEEVRGKKGGRLVSEEKVDLVRFRGAWTYEVGWRRLHCGIYRWDSPQNRGRSLPLRGVEMAGLMARKDFALLNP
jgi:hypothetical protein